MQVATEGQHNKQRASPDPGLARKPADRIAGTLKLGHGPKVAPVRPNEAGEARTTRSRSGTLATPPSSHWVRLTLLAVASPMRPSTSRVRRLPRAEARSPSP